MVVSMLVKQMHNLGGENFNARWIENPYWQYFYGETLFQYDEPYDPIDLVHCRKRIGKEGEQKILKLRMSLLDSKEIYEKGTLIDTTYQEKTMTYLTNYKLHKKFIEGCLKMNKERIRS